MFSHVAFGQTDASLGYAFEREMPVFLDQLKAELTYPMAWGHCEIKNFGLWRQAARQVVMEAMMAPPPYPASFETVVEASETRDGYTARRILFNLTSYSRVHAYVLTPNGKGPFPAVVLLHDHGGHFSIGKEKMVRPFDVPAEVLADADKWVAGGYGGRYLGDYLAKNGFVVIAIDALFWGERGRKEGIDGKKYGDIAGNMMMLGRSLSAFMNYEDLYTVDFLTTLPEVDAERIGCVGWSMGGYRSWMLASLTDKVKAGVSVCWMNTTDNQFSWEYGRERGGFANMLPGIRRYLDYPHIASIACPKPMMFLNGERDKLFAPAGVREAFRQMHEVWSSQGADDKLQTELLNMGHECGIEVQDVILTFFQKTLGKRK